MLPGCGHQVALHRLALWSRFSEACTEHDGHRCAALGKVGYHLDRRLCCDRDDRHFGRLWKCIHRSVCGQALHRGPTRIDRQYETGEALRQHVGDRATAYAQRVVGGTDDGHASGVKQGIKGLGSVCTHVGNFSLFLPRTP